ncbi:hypothetical protein [Leptospira meyeri]|uniref:hypothetical protein n=1 Tax=Leptospira meyeri TaxID=29508 RepID=UPI0002BE96EA|nr:hypothetical protein [Leptospira meyeri]EMJ87259.1 hypothetical protein LEP1GSC196_2972 [Leptospira meyeri serovar Semaranga str. Veldrot Semarang 173]
MENFALTQSVTTIRNLYKLIQRDMLFIFSLFIIHFLHGSGTIQISYININISQPDANITIFLINSLLCISTMAHLCKIYILQKTIDNILKKSFEIPNVSDESAFLINISTTESAYYLSDNFISDFIITGTDRIPSLRRFVYVSLILSILFLILSLYYVLATELKSNFDTDIAAFAIISLVYLTSLSILFISIVFKRSIIGEKKNRLSILVRNLGIANNSIKLLISSGKTNWISTESEIFSGMLENYNFLINLYDIKGIDKKIEIFNIQATKSIEDIKNEIEKIYKISKSLAETNDLIQHRGYLERFIEDYKDSQDYNDYQLFLEYNGIFTFPENKNKTRTFLKYLIGKNV